MAYYKRYIPGIRLSLVKGTGNVPNDGKYYVLQNEKIIASFRSQKEADKRFEELVVESGYKANVSAKGENTPTQASIERYLDAKALFYAIGPIRKKGGRGGRGGV
jgi:hypothetical protein